ncbi:MAG TPA: hypothetical protein VNT26_23770, partial [Candidatus Sulfotelmatobacter sp.]|nr:hypothetical protein [Candidatus Sulfotelmatobacter sp.]
RIIEEITSANMGIKQFARMVVRSRLRDHFGPWWRDKELLLRSYGDPAGNNRAETDEKSCLDILREAEIDIPTRPASTNAFLPRREAVATFLLREDGFAMSKHCKTLRKGFLGGYHYSRLQVSTAGGEALYTDKPKKNRYSHPHDGLQYLALGASDQDDADWS